MNEAKRDSAKIKKYEVAFRYWLKRIFKAFGKFTLAHIVESLKTDRDLPPNLKEVFMRKIDFEFLNVIFEEILKQNEKFYEKLLKKSYKGKYIVPRKFSSDLLERTLIQRALYNSFMQDDVQKKRKNFFELEKDVVDAELENIYTKRKNQLDEFRQSYLFNSPDNGKVFIEKYPEPKYKFADSMGRTQINNLNRDLSATIATNMGAKKCEWVTSGDERVRESHRKLNHKVFSYDDLPSEYNDYNCRCELLPILTSIEGLF